MRMNKSMFGSKMPLSLKRRITLWYLGLFSATLMTDYTLSGMVKIFKETNFLKSEVTILRQLTKPIKR